MKSFTVNGQCKSLTQTLTIMDLLRDLGLAERRVAVELNQEIVPRSRHAETRIEPGDQVEIVHAIGGG
jgi:sulfur carrier protein